MTEADSRDPAMTDAANRVFEAYRMLATLSDGEFDAALKWLQTSRDRQRDDLLVRQLVADSYGRPSGPTSALPEAQADALTQRPVRRGTGWAEEIPLDRWSPPGQAIIDRLMDSDDRATRARRQAQVERAKGGE